jgi:type II secretory pathway pseudopilin PulG
VEEAYGQRCGSGSAPEERAAGPASSRRGYSLIEVLFAVFFVSVVFLGLSGMTAMVMKSQSTNELADVALDLAQDKLEELKSAPLSSPALADLNSGNNGELGSATDFDYQEAGIDERGRPGGIFTRTWNLADDLPKSGMKTAVVIVSWTDRLGGHEVSLRTIL